MMKLDAKEAMAAQAYAAYMIATSYFKSYVCTTPQMENQTYLLYRLLGADNQCRMEARLISFMEKRVLPELSEEFLGSKVEAAIFPDGAGVRISDGFEELIIRQTLKEMRGGREEGKYEIQIAAEIREIEEEE
ncbi:MAG: hypothetical protein IJ110_05715 [Lachnospiraceae bacterium]|jgi:hypothetical protein|nr:hypothetical protein [Lachnospiraceae bacterium]